MDKPFIYVAAPLSKGNQFLNVRRAIVTGHKLAKMGYGVFIPHLNCLWELAIGDEEADYEFWLDQDMQVLVRCNVMFAHDGESPGRDREVKRCGERGIPVLYTMEQAEAWLKNYEAKAHLAARGS